MARIVVLALCFHAVPLAAQPQLLVTPDTLFVHETFEDPFTLTNTGTEPLTLDSLYFRNIGEWFFAMYGRLEVDQEAYFLYQFFNGSSGDVWREWSPDWTVNGLVLEPDSTAQLFVDGFDSCPICRGPEAYIPVDFFPHGIFEPYVATIGFNIPVSTEPNLYRSGLTLGLYPNPTKGVVAILLTVTRPNRVRAIVVDVLGREVYQRDLGTLSAGSHSVPIHLLGVAPGIYFVRIVSGDARDSSAAVRRIVILP